MSVSTGSRSFLASSGSRSASSSMEPLRSAKRTVTCFRSPSRAAFEVRIFSARCFGVYESGAANLDVGVVRSGAAHWPQNLFSGRLTARQDGQVEASGAAHCPQNFIPVGFSCWHREHFILWEPPKWGWRTIPRSLSTLTRREGVANGADAGRRRSSVRSPPGEVSSGATLGAQEKLVPRVHLVLGPSPPSAPRRRAARHAPARKARRSITRSPDPLRAAAKVGS